ncbi:uncharacterized protein K460DRAFT_415619 [Cucurbitaria berberidis CBS 394.84]|uniref:Mid2 domain-containing protein n=1 Tax=Cucurbitaria berberidis CBS 394.84 TaxID=1168544 RepID=A0A9P4GPV1_9PLEO|nr:uncharacterized protein K460DRAFT_415619 [Cucurbitaria berberidis CBS 394.84]KAF1849211.1 hypothetical protein K460DRAFT_415619 [Cucurbitaria berberidis CBS 394.84]
MSSLSIILLIATLVEVSVSSCFLPNGTALDDRWAQSCSPDPRNPLHTVCCHTKWENPPGGDIILGPTADECLPNGLCQNRGWSSVEGDKKPPWTHYYRVYCTNQDWSGCLDVCNIGLAADDVAQITPCDQSGTSEKWCCGNSTDCCTSGSASEIVIIPRALGNLTSGSLSPPPGTDTNKNNARKRRNMRIGAGVGIGFGVPALGVIIWWCLWHRRKTNKENLDPSDEISLRQTETLGTRHAVIGRSDTHGQI